jgi:hypothetical protein
MNKLQRRKIYGWTGSLAGLLLMWGVIHNYVLKEEINPIMQQRHAYTTALAGVGAKTPGIQENEDCVVCGRYPPSSFDPRNLGSMPGIETVAEEEGCDLSIQPVNHRYKIVDFGNRDKKYSLICVRF